MFFWETKNFKNYVSGLLGKRNKRTKTSQGRLAVTGGGEPALLHSFLTTRDTVGRKPIQVAQAPDKKSHVALFLEDTTKYLVAPVP